MEQQHIYLVNVYFSKCYKCGISGIETLTTISSAVAIATSTGGISLIASEF